MAKLFEMFSTNRKFETEGVVIDMGEGTTFRVARRSKTNKRYSKALELATKPVQAVIDNLSNEQSEAILMSVFCKTILLGWTGVQYDERMGTLSPPPNHDGYVEFSEHNAMQLMKALPDLYDTLLMQSAKMANFRDAENEEDAKN